MGESGTQWSYDPDALIGDIGGFGVVFRGAGPDGQAAAVKRVRLQWDSEGARRLREREVEIGRLLNSFRAEHVMYLLDVGRVDDDLLLVMPLAARSLAAAIKTGDFDMTARLEALSQVAKGLVELSEISVLHRDLKPSNVLYADDRWLLADFASPAIS